MNRRWFRFSLGNLFALTLGIVLGFAPFRLHEAFAPPSEQVRVDLEISEMDQDDLSKLGLEARPSEDWERPDATFLKNWSECRQGGRLDVLTGPSVIAVSGKECNIMVGHSPLAIIDDSNSPSIVYVGTELKVRPTILRNGRVQLELGTTIRDPPDQAANDMRHRTFEFTTEVEDGERILFRSQSGNSSRLRELIMLVRVRRVK